MLQELASAQVEFLERNKKGKHLENRLPFILQTFYSACLSVDNHSVLTSKFFNLYFSPLSKTRLYLAPIKMALIWQENFDLLISYLRKLSLPRSVVCQTISKPNKPANSVGRFIIGPSPLHAIRKLPVKTKEKKQKLRNREIWQPPRRRKIPWPPKVFFSRARVLWVVSRRRRSNRNRKTRMKSLHGTRRTSMKNQYINQTNSIKLSCLSPTYLWLTLRGRKLWSSQSSWRGISIT